MRNLWAEPLCGTFVRNLREESSSSWVGLTARTEVYYDSFNPALLFLSGGGIGEEPDSQVFLLLFAVLLAMGFHRVLTRESPPAAWLSIRRLLRGADRGGADRATASAAEAAADGGRSPRSSASIGAAHPVSRAALNSRWTTDRLAIDQRSTPSGPRCIAAVDCSLVTCKSTNYREQREQYAH